MLTIGQRIKKLREDADTSRVAMARALGIKETRIQDIERGKQKLPSDLLTKIGNYFDVDVEFILTGLTRAERERRFAVGIDALRSTTKATAGHGLSVVEQTLLQELLYYTETGDSAGLRKALKRLKELSPREAALLDNFRHAGADAQDALVKTGAAMAKQVVVKKKATS